jgi:iron complex outermembrane receptor protein
MRPGVNQHSDASLRCDPRVSTRVEGAEMRRLAGGTPLQRGKRSVNFCRESDDLVLIHLIFGLPKGGGRLTTNTSYRPGGAPCDHPQNLGDKLVKNSTGKRSAAAFKLKPTMAFAGQATAGALVALAATGSVFAQGASPHGARGVGAGNCATRGRCNAAPDAQQVVVTGIRRGIEAAISVKKNSDQIVEAISAEDIGKLPDTTIAESLARLPGVTAQRDKNGKATNVSIRGLGPDFNGYLLNGREQTSTGDSRADDLSVYPAELIAGATVYKTGDASLMTAGLAGTIDNKLIDPLSFPQRVSRSHRREDPDRARVSSRSATATAFAGLRRPVRRPQDRRRARLRARVRPQHQVGVGQLGRARTATRTPTATTAITQHQPAGLRRRPERANTHVRDDRDGLAGVLEFKPNDELHQRVRLLSRARSSPTTKNAYAEGGSAACPITTRPSTAAHQITSGTFRLGANPNGLIDYAENIFDDDTLQSVGWRNEPSSATPGASADVSHNTAKRVERDIEAYGGITARRHAELHAARRLRRAAADGRQRRRPTDPTNIVIRDQTGWSGIHGVPQDGYDKGPTTIDKINARAWTSRTTCRRHVQRPAVRRQHHQRTKDRKATKALIVSGRGRHNPIPYPAGSYVEQQRRRHRHQPADLRSDGQPVPRARSCSQVQQRHPVQDLERQENVSTGYGKLDIDTSRQDPAARQRRPAIRLHEPASAASRPIGSDVTLTNPAAGLSTTGTQLHRLPAVVEPRRRPRQRQPAALRRRHPDRAAGHDRHAQLVRGRLQRNGGRRTTARCWRLVGQSVPEAVQGQGAGPLVREVLRQQGSAT